MNRISALSPISRALTRRFTTSQIKREKPDMTEMKKKQLHFQMDNNVPIYLKGGTLDYVLYYTTLGLTIFSTVMTSYGLYKVMLKRN